jgi:nanoRNase/pAp phosphatase (c-di-AMP/oligoRNAs hydrolase)
MEKHDELRQVLSQAQDKPLVILLGGHPDPDAIGSALAHQRICEQLGVPATIAHVLPVARAENRAILKLLNVQMLRVSEPKDLEPFTYLSLVDASQSESTLELPDHLQLLTVVDHHRPTSLPKAQFCDVRHDVGATCTLYAQYMEKGLVPLSVEGRGDSPIATAMFFGIQTDTADFAHATSADFRAAAYLKPHCDADTLSRVGRRTMSAEAMKVVKRALLDLEVIRDFALAGVGQVSSVNRDAIPIAADFLMRREDIDTVLVYGVVDGRIDGSLRTNSPSVDPATFMLNAFGADGAGRPYGGGRADMGGFQVPLGVLAETEDEDAIWSLVKEVVKARVARVIPDLSPRRGSKDSATNGD